jgi:AraC-like DNA-binding protein
VQPAASVRDFVRDPWGRYVAGRTWLFFAPYRELSGFMLWGQADLADAADFLGTWPTPGSPLAERHARLVDVRRLVAPTPLPYQMLLDRCAANRDLLEHAVLKVAIAHAGGVVGAAAAGFSAIAPTHFETALFTEAGAAMEWLGAGTPGALALELDDLQARSLGTPRILLDLRVHLEARTRDATLPTAARALGLSTRSLQRRLTEQGTSFQRELDRTRVQVAKRLLQETDTPIDVVAGEVGCASRHHFGAVFLKVVGLPPGRWRADHRAR